MIYDGLEYGDAQTCPTAFKTMDRNSCTHGPDPAPLNVDVRTAAPAPITSNAPSQISAIQCEGDGAIGYRIQVLYVRGSDDDNCVPQFIA